MVEKNSKVDPLTTSRCRRLFSGWFRCGVQPCFLRIFRVSSLSIFLGTQKGRCIVRKTSHNPMIYGLPAHHLHYKSPKRIKRMPKKSMALFFGRNCSASWALGLAAIPGGTSVKPLVLSAVRSEQTWQATVWGVSTETQSYRRPGRSEGLGIDVNHGAGIFAYIFLITQLWWVNSPWFASGDGNCPEMEDC